MPPLDFFSENVWPFTTIDVRRKHYVLQKGCPESAGEVIERAVPLRDRGRQIGKPREGPPVEPGTEGLVPLPPPRPEPPTQGVVPLPPPRPEPDPLCGPA